MFVRRGALPGKFVLGVASAQTGQEAREGCGCGGLVSRLVSRKRQSLPMLQSFSFSSHSTLGVLS